jgi:hypothetical protein
MMGRFLIVLALAVSMLSGRLAAGVHAAEAPRPDAVAEATQGAQTDRVTRTVNIGANGEIEIANIAGNIVVTRGSGTSASIVAVKTARGGSADDARAMLAAVQVEIIERGSRVEVRTRYPEGNEWRRNRRNVDVSVDINVAAPEGTRVTVKSISGEINVKDITGPLTLESVSGSVHIANAGREATGRSISGNVELVDTRVDGDLEVGSVSGTIKLTRVAARSVKANSVSGNIELQGVDSQRIHGQVISGDVLFSGNLDANGRYELASHSGTVQVTVPAGSSFQLEATSFSGSINTDIPITMSGGQPGRRNRALRGTVGSGGAILDLTTFSGSILIKKQ